MNICEYCNREFKNSGGLGSHLRSCKENTERKPWKREAWNKGKSNLQVPWNKGITKENDCRLAKISKNSKGKKFGSFRSHSNETKQRLSEYAKARDLGGLVEGSGRGKKGRYKGVYCDSSWELAYLIYCEEHGIAIERCAEIFEYEYEGKVRKYNPDFIVNGKYVEIKGYKTEQWKQKLAQFPYEIEVLYEAEMKPILEFVQSKYGNFLSLYD